MTTTAARNRSVMTPLGSAYARAVEDFIKSVSCPRCEYDVYAIGISLEYFVGSVFVALAEMDRNVSGSEYTRLAMMQLERKEKIVAVNNNKLNQMLQYFYDNGGPIIEPPVDEQKAARIAPRFNAIINEFCDRMDVLVNESSSGRMGAREMEKETNAAVLEVYTASKALYREYELRNAFDDLLRFRTNKD